MGPPLEHLVQLIFLDCYIRLQCLRILPLEPVKSRFTFAGAENFQAVVHNRVSFSSPRGVNPLGFLHAKLAA